MRSKIFLKQTRKRKQNPHQKFKLYYKLIKYESIVLLGKSGRLVRHKNYFPSYLQLSLLDSFNQTLTNTSHQMQIIIIHYYEML